MDDNYFEEKLWQLGLDFHDDNSKTILKQIAADAREEQAGEDKDAVKEIGAIQMESITGKMVQWIIKDDALAAIDRVKGE
jgi:hypothetical protein